MNRSLAAAAVVLVLAACSHPEPPPPPAPLVITHRVSFAEGDALARYSGDVMPRYASTLSFRVGGKVLRRLVEVGDRVRPGQPLATLDPGDVRLSEQAARAQLKVAEVDVAYATSEYERFKALRDKNFVSQGLLEAKQAALEAAKAKRDAAKAQGGLAGNQAGYATLVADSAGVVAAVFADAGQVVAPGQPVVRVAQSSGVAGEVEVAISVPENRLAELKRTDSIEIRMWADVARVYHGRIREVAPVADPMTRTYGVRITVLDPDADLRLGMTAHVLLARKGETPTAMLPAPAIFQQGKQPAVWVIGTDRKLTLKPVEVVAWREDGVQVRGGVAEGDLIVAAGAHKLRAGEVVRLPGDATAVAVTK